MEANYMTPENQRIAIAEALGWIFDHSRKSYQRQGQWCIELPNYLNDLNAMHEAEKVLTTPQWFDYLKELTAIGCKNKSSTGYQAIDPIHATAAQRAEAFLRTLGLWI